MNEFMEGTSLFLQSAVQMGTPLLFGTLGGIFCEKVGHLNLGIEGMMLMGAVMGFITSDFSHNPILAFVAAGLAGAFGALLYAIVTVSFKGNHTVTGLVLSIFGAGFSNFIGADYTVLTRPAEVSSFWAVREIPVLSQIPILGKMLFTQSPFVLIALVVAVLSFLYLKKTKYGLNMRMIGENPGAADAAGINVSLYKYLHIIAGGFICGLGGAFLSLYYLGGWKENMTSGLGWISVALVIFSTWSPVKAIFGAYLFGILRVLPIKIQNVSLPVVGVVPSQFLDMLPYLMTVIVLVITSIRKKRENQPPAALGSIYYREDR